MAFQTTAWMLHLPCPCKGSWASHKPLRALWCLPCPPGACGGFPCTLPPGCLSGPGLYSKFTDHVGSHVVFFDAPWVTVTITDLTSGSWDQVPARESGCGGTGFGQWLTLSFPFPPLIQALCRSVMRHKAAGRRFGAESWFLCDLETLVQGCLRSRPYSFHAPCRYQRGKYSWHLPETVIRLY